MNRSRKILIVVGVILSFAILIPVIHHYQLRFAVTAYIAELKAKGEPMDLAQVIPPPVPSGQNGASMFLKGASLFNTNSNDLDSDPSAMRMVAPGKAMIGWEQSDIRSKEGTNTWAEIKKALARDNQALKLIGQITNNSAFDFNLQYTQRFKMMLTHLILEKKAAQKLASATVYDLNCGDTTSAVQNVRVALVLVKGTHEERTAISQLVRIAITQIVLAANWELLQSTNLTDKQLGELQADWSGLEFVEAAERVLPVEREGGETTLAELRSSNSELQSYFDIRKQAHEAMGSSAEENSIWDKTEMKMKIFLWRYWWSYSDELRALKGYEVVVNTIRLTEHTVPFQKALSTQETELGQLGISKLDSSFDSLFTGEMDFNSMLSGAVVTMTGVVRKVMRVEVAKKTVVAAVALKRYQLKHGIYPANLNSLVPEFLSTVPLDPVDLQPLRYRRNANGTFLLYSIGENGVDDGGDPSLEKGVPSSNYYWQNLHALDWVWPQPATEKEVQAYYQTISSKSN